MTAMAPTGLKATVQDTNLLQERSGCLPPRLALRTVWLRLATGLLANCTLLRRLRLLRRRSVLRRLRSALPALLVVSERVTRNMG